MVAISGSDGSALIVVEQLVQPGEREHGCRFLADSVAPPQEPPRRQLSRTAHSLHAGNQDSHA